MTGDPTELLLVTFFATTDEVGVWMLPHQHPRRVDLRSGHAESTQSYASKASNTNSFGRYFFYTQFSGSKTLSRYTLGYFIQRLATTERRLEVTLLPS